MSQHLRPGDRDSSMEISLANGDDRSTPRGEAFGDYERTFPRTATGAAVDQSDDPTVYDKQVFIIPEDRKLGYWSTAALISNCMIGTGIFLTPSMILQATGTPAGTLLLWCFGSFFAYCGMSVYLELGTAIPRSGGEKVYLERIYRKPRYIATCVYAVQFILLGNTAGNAVASARYFIRALNPGKYASSAQFDKTEPPVPPEGLQKALAIGVISINCLIHLYWPKFGGRYLMMGFATLKISLLVLVVLAGIAAATGRGHNNPQRTNFSGDGAWKKDPSNNAPGNWAAALLGIAFSFRGWENANYVLGEVRRPAKTLRVSVPIAMLGVATLYILANIAYFVALPKAVIQESGITVAADFFLDVFGDNAFSSVIVPLCISASAFGNVLSVTFANSRVKQELGKEGILPWSRFWASDKPFGTPAAALLLHWVFSVLVISVPNAEDAYKFSVWIFTYSQTWVALFIGAGLLHLQYSPSQKRLWAEERTDYHVWWPLTVTFTLTCLFLVVAPFIPNEHPGGTTVTGKLPFYAFPAASCCTLAAGFVYWAGFAKVWPKFGFTLEVERSEDQLGNEVVKYKHVKRKRETHVEASSTSALPRFGEPMGPDERQAAQGRGEEKGEGSPHIPPDGGFHALTHPPESHMKI